MLFGHSYDRRPSAHFLSCGVALGGVAGEQSSDQHKSFISIRRILRLHFLGKAWAFTWSFQCANRLDLCVQGPPSITSIDANTCGMINECNTFPTNEPAIFSLGNKTSQFLTWLTRNADPVQISVHWDAHFSSLAATVHREMWVKCRCLQAEEARNDS
jgi:hypothetical protein